MGNRTLHIAGYIALAALLLPPAAQAAPQFDMVKVTGGCFQMGDSFGDGDNDEKPVHKVCVKDFSIGKYEVTQAQWQAVMGSNPSEAKGDKLPVEQVSWADAIEFVKKLRQETGVAYRLPLEAEWEFAARNGGKTEKWAGASDETQLADYAWYDKNSGGKTNDIGTKKPNGLGIHDLSGNVSEWCMDRYGEEFYKESVQDSPQGPATSTSRVVRGGSWVDDAWSVRTVRRGGRKPESKTPYNGLRLAIPSQ